MPKKPWLIGTVITDKARLDEIEALCREKIKLHQNCTEESLRRRCEIKEILYDAFEVPAKLRTFSDRNLDFDTHALRLITASRNSICITEKHLDLDVEVVWGQKGHHALIIGFLEDKRLHLELLGAPELKQRNRVARPSEVERATALSKVEAQEIAKKAFRLLGVDDFRALSLAYTEQDQKLMKSHRWDDEDPTLLTNRVKDTLQNIDPANLNEEDREWWHEIMWFWHHHATSCAIWKRKDPALARQYADKAIELQPLGHPNRITKLLQLLSYDRHEEAKEYVACLTTEAETAQFTLAQYERGDFF